MVKEEEQVSCVEIIHDSVSNTNSHDSFDLILSDLEKDSDLSDNSHQNVCQNMVIAQDNKPLISQIRGGENFEMDPEFTEVVEQSWIRDCEHIYQDDLESKINAIFEKHTRIHESELYSFINEDKLDAEWFCKI